MVLTFEDFKIKFRPFTTEDGNLKIFESSDVEVKEKKNQNKVWDINFQNRDNTIMKIIPNKKQFITFGMHLVTQRSFTQNDQENLKVINI